MFLAKYVIYIACGVCLLFIGVPRLPFHLDLEISSIYSFLWLTLAIFFVTANWRCMKRINFMYRLQEEQRRRKKWLEAQSQLSGSNIKYSRDRRRAIETIT